MKLIFCPQCHDVFKLTRSEERQCKCGYCSGRYIDNLNAVTNGNGYSIAIGNGSIETGIYYLLGNMHHDRDWYKNNNQLLCWMRPNEGSGNPHSKVEIDNLENKIESIQNK